MTAAASSFSDTAIARSTVAMTALTLVSRLFGVVRLLVMAAVLGATFLGNTYESANSLPNLLFELFAAGSLQAVLVPTLVGLIQSDESATARHVTSSLLGIGGATLGVLAIAGMLLAEPLMHVMVSGVDDPAVRRAQVELGATFLRFFLPQVVLYLCGLVATAYLNAHGRFALPVIAPAVSSVVMIVVYSTFWWLRDGAAPSLQLSGVQQAVLAGGTTLGVLALVLVPVAGAMSLGFSLRPRFEYRDPLVRDIARRGAWAGVYLAMKQALLFVLLVVANGTEGGVIAYRIAFTFFLLPHALFAAPVFTALFPRMSSAANGGDWADYARSVRRGVATIVLFAFPATALFVALSEPIGSVALFGAAGAGADDIAAALAGFAPGLAGYGAFLLLTRAFYAAGDARTPALVSIVVAVVGSIAIVAGAAAWTNDVAAAAWSHSGAYAVGTVVLAALLQRRATLRLRDLGRPLAVSLGGAILAGAAMGAVASFAAPGDAVADALTIGAAVVAGALVYLAVQRVLGGTTFHSYLTVMRGNRGNP